jgi:membrane protein
LLRINQRTTGAAVRSWNIIHQTVARWTRNDGNLLAASMAYYAAFSFFPLLMVLISGLGFALHFSSSAQGAQRELLDFISEHTGPVLAERVQDVLAEVQTRAPYSGPVGLITLLFGAIGILSQLESAFDKLWQAETPHDRGFGAAVRNALWNRLKAFLTLLGLGLVVIVAFVADLLLTAIRNRTQGLPIDNSFWQWTQFALVVALNAAVLTLLYKLIPRVSVRWSHAACGGAIVAIVWQLGSQLVSRFITGDNYSAYGVVGSFIAMMLWVYCASIVLFMGAQLVQVLGYPGSNAGNGITPAPGATPGREKKVN